MPLPRYNPSEARLQTGAGIAENAQAQTWQTLSNKLDQWSGYAYKQGADARDKQGKTDAEQAFLGEGKNAKITEDYTIHGQSYNNSLKALQAKQVSLDTNNSLRGYFEENIESEAGFLNQAESYHKGAIKEMPEYLRAEYSIDFEAKKANYVAKVRTNEKKKNDDIKLATGNDFHKQQFSLATQASRDGSPKLAMVEAEKAEANLTDLKDARLISAVEYEKQVDKLYKGVADAKFQGENDRLIETNDVQGSQKYITNFRKTKNTLYTDEERESLADEMQTQLNKKLVALRANDKKDEENATLILKSVLETKKSGGTSVYSEDEIKSAMKLSTSKQTVFDLETQFQIEKNAPGWRGLSLTEKEDIVTRLKTSKRTPASQELINQMESDLKETSQRVKNDVVGLAIEQGVIPQPNIGMSASDGIDSLIEGINQIDTHTIKETYGDNATNLLTKEDANSWKNFFEAPGNVIEKVDYISRIASLSPTKAKAVYNQIAGKDAPTFGFVANLVTSGNKDAAIVALKGKNSGIKLENPNVFKSEVDKKLAGVYSHDITGTILNRNSIGIINYNKGIVSEGSEQLDASEAVEATFGTVETYNGKDVLIPRGIEKGDFEDWLGNLKTVINDSLATEIADSISFFGAKTVQIHTVGNGKYKVYKTNNGKGYYVEGKENGQPLILDYYKGVYKNDR